MTKSHVNLSPVRFSRTSLAREQMLGHFGTNEPVRFSFETHPAHFLTNSPVSDFGELVFHLQPKKYIKHLQMKVFGPLTAKSLTPCSFLGGLVSALDLLSGLVELSMSMRAFLATGPTDLALCLVLVKLACVEPAMSTPRFSMLLRSLLTERSLTCNN